MDFSQRLIAWYRLNKRSLPWRESQDPYRIWLSEVILQQTRVEQGLPYYRSFVKAYPTIKSLARASEDEVLKLWQGLGYYSRARNMLVTARVIASEYKGKFPQTARELMRLKGIGPYTAAAIASFAFNEASPVVDGNVFRLLSRYLGIKEPIDSTKARQMFTEAAGRLMDKSQPADFNQAIMEFGSGHCKPSKPDCSSCIFGDSCYAKAKKQQSMLPVKKVRAPLKERYFNYLLLSNGRHSLIQKRSGKDIWKNLYELPLMETEAPISGKQLSRSPFFKTLTGGNAHLLHPFEETRQKLSHQLIHTRFWKVDLQTPDLHPGENHIKIRLDEFGSFAIPRVLDIYLKKIK